MKQYFLIAALTTMAWAGFAQGIETTKLTELVKQKNYVNAIQELNAMKKTIQELAAAELQKAFPAKVGEYALEPTSGSTSEMGGGLNLSLTYKKPELAKPASAPDPMGQDPNMMAGMMPGMTTAPGMATMSNALQLTVSTNLMMANEVLMAHGGEDMGMVGMGVSEPIRIKGFRALLKHDEFSGASGQMIVGGAFVRVSMSGAKDTNTVKALLEAIDAEKLKAMVGE